MSDNLSQQDNTEVVISEGRPRRLQECQGLLGVGDSPGSLPARVLIEIHK